MRARGWAPRALLSAATAPLGIALGLGAAVASAALHRPGLAVIGVVLAGAPGLFHAARATVLDRELRGRHSAGVPLAAAAGVHEVLDQPEVVDHEVVEHPVVVGPVVDLRVDAHDDRRIDTGELQLMWDAGDGPDTGEVPVAPTALPDLPEHLELAAMVVPAAFAAAQAPAPSRRPRVGTIEARVYDALAHADADELTRTLEGPSRRGRHAADAVYDAPPRTGPVRRIEAPRSITPRKGRHAA
ncbi:MAG TPA: hypothetical protein VFD41_04715 [Actinomycetales bacterium]|nr:hypothetical protein [Actinomycetales bacterium]